MRSKLTALLIAALAVAALATGCYRHHIVLEEPSPTVVRAQSDIHKFFVIGLVGIGGVLPLDSMCSNGTSRIYLRAGVINLVAAFLSGNLVTARSSLFLCNAEGGYSEGETQTRTPVAVEARAGD